MAKDQILEFHKQIVDLVKKYQFRDRNEMSAFGISVSQCYILETLHTYGDLTMNELAKKMYLSISTVTRVVEQLVRKRYVRREETPNDRRVRLITLTGAGRALYQKAWQKVFVSERTILENLPAANRKVVIDFLATLNRAVESWRYSCCKS